MQSITVDLANGRSVAFTVTDNAVADPRFVLGIRKCGSSLLNSMLNDLGRLNGMTFVDVGGTFFAANIAEEEWRRDPAVLAMLAPGMVYGGFRTMPLVFAQSEIYRRSRKILLVRDPRDALVSEYFSIAYSHGLPDGDADGGVRAEFLEMRRVALASRIETVVLERASLMNQAFVEYAAAAADPLTKVYRYEDVIFAKRPWLHSMAAHFGWKADMPGLEDGMMGWADKVPAEEQSHAFIRRVTPGDHREKLSASVIAALDGVLAPAMRLFGYS